MDNRNEVREFLTTRGERGHSARGQGPGRRQTVRGLVEVHWRQTEQDLTVEAAVPAGVTGVIRLPGQPDRELVSSRQTITVPVHHRRKSGDAMNDVDRAGDIVAKMSLEDKIALACAAPLQNLVELSLRSSRARRPRNGPHVCQQSSWHNRRPIAGRRTGRGFSDNSQLERGLTEWRSGHAGPFSGASTRSKSMLVHGRS
jgi:hypothetical protein